MTDVEEAKRVAMLLDFEVEKVRVREILEREGLPKWRIDLAIESAEFYQSLQFR
jgi:PP-loop superfamily ATP-utilizing enzyme